MAIYTKSGDKGFTGLINGKRVSKTDPRICAIGDLDELNAVIGILRTLKQKKSHNKILAKIQKDIYFISAELAGFGTKFQTPNSKIPKISVSNVKFIEKNIDILENQLPKLTKFVTPGGNLFQSFCHFSRTVCRRAERSAVALKQKKKPEILIYLNRLSDLLFIMSCPS